MGSPVPSLLCPSSFYTPPLIQLYSALHLTSPIPIGKAGSDPLTTLLVTALQCKQQPHFKEEETKASLILYLLETAEVSKGR